MIRVIGLFPEHDYGSLEALAVATWNTDRNLAALAIRAGSEDAPLNRPGDVRGPLGTRLSLPRCLPLLPSCCLVALAAPVPYSVLYDQSNTRLCCGTKCFAKNLWPRRSTCRLQPDLTQGQRDLG